MYLLGGGRSKFLSEKGFTLAETLVTLGIVGIVAAMTLPSIVQKHQEKVTVSKLKKIYSTVSHAYLNAIRENGSPENWGMTLYTPGEDGQDEDRSGANVFLKNISPYLKVIKNCLYGSECDEMKWNVNALNGTSNGSSANTRLVLSDGIMLSGSWIYAENCDKVMGRGVLNNVCGEFFVDLNGVKAPNTIGKDIFVFYITKTSIIPFGTQIETYRPFEKNCVVNSTGAGYGYGCTAWVIYNENMDYLHCNDLSWQGKHKCN